MVEHLTMNTVVHAAVRRDLERLEQALDELPVGAREPAERVDRAWRFLDGQLTHHHHSEEELFWPALRELGVGADLVGDLDGEHQLMADSMCFTRAAMSALAADPTAEHIADAHTAVTRLRDTIETHFTHEERDLEPIAAKLESTPEMKRAAAGVRKTQSLPTAAVFLSWLLDDADPSARALVEGLAPKPLLVVVLRLFGGPYRRVALA